MSDSKFEDQEAFEAAIQTGEIVFPEIPNEVAGMINMESTAPEKYWFYCYFSFGGAYSVKGFHHSQVFECDKPRGTLGRFDKKQAVGPFDSMLEGIQALQVYVTMNQDAGHATYQHNGRC